MILNLDAIPLEELKKMLAERERYLEIETAKFREQVSPSVEALCEHRILRYGITENILAIERAIARKKSIKVKYIGEDGFKC